VLRSWAVPKGPSLRPGDKRLAVEVEDHPLDYADFAGDIPEGQYGAGHVDIFDRGTWSPVGDPAEAIRQGKLDFELDGEHLRGGWKLVRTQPTGSGKPQWLLLKRDDDAARDAEADDLMPEALQDSTRIDEQRRAARRRRPAKSAKTAKPARSAKAARAVKKDPAPRRARSGDWAARAASLPGAARLRKDDVVEPQLALAAKVTTARRRLAARGQVGRLPDARAAARRAGTHPIAQRTGLDRPAAGAGRVAGGAAGCRRGPGRRAGGAGRQWPERLRPPAAGAQAVPQRQPALCRVRPADPGRGGPAQGGAPGSQGAAARPAGRRRRPAPVLQQPRTGQRCRGLPGIPGRGHGGHHQQAGGRTVRGRAQR
jgi:hypothetical protein